MFKRISKLVYMSKREYITRQGICFFMILAYTITSLAFPGFISIIVDDGINTGNVQTIIRYVFIMFLLGISTIIFQYLQKIQFLKLGQDIIKGLRENLMRVILKTNIFFWSDNRIGDVFNIFDSDVQQVETLFTTILSSVILNAFVLISILMYIIWSDKLIGIIITFLAFSIYFLQKRVGKNVQSNMYILRNQIGDLVSCTNEILNNVNAIQVSGNRNSKVKEYIKFNDFVIGSTITQIKNISIGQAIGMLFNVLGLFTVLFVGAIRVANGTMSVGVLFSLTIYVQRVYSPIAALGDSYISIKNMIPIIDKLNYVLDTENIMKEGKYIGSSEEDLKLELDDVCFQYSPDCKVLEHLSFTIEPNSIVGIVGDNGCGKTTLVRLIMRFCEPISGTIKLNNRNISEYDVDYYFSQFGYMLQNTYVMTGKLRDVLNPNNKSLDDEKLIEMMNYFELNIDKFENGLDTEIGENKLNISGGEAQKISLIRLFLEDRPFYILDEPTAAVDIESDRIICNKIKELLKGKSAIIITHRTNILSICDRVVRL